MSRYLLGSMTCGSALLMAAIAGAQVPQSGHTTSAVEQLGLDDGPAATTAAGQLRELICLGKAGIDLRVDREPSPREPKLVAMVLRCERPKAVRVLGQEGMGTVDYGMSLEHLPGTCSWNAGLYPGIPLEPRIVYFDLPRDAQACHAPLASLRPRVRRLQRRAPAGGKTLAPRARPRSPEAYGM